MAKNLESIDAKFSRQVQELLIGAHEGLNQRLAAMPAIPALGTDVPPVDRASQLQNIGERCRADLALFRDYLQKALDTNDRALADQLVAVARSNSVEGGPWSRNPEHDQLWGSAFGQGPAGLVAEAREHFLTPRGAAGAVNTTLTALQLQELSALATALNDPNALDHLPVLLGNRAYPWLQGVPDGVDPADVYGELVKLGSPPDDQPAELDREGTRLTSIDAEARAMRQYAGDVGSRGT